MAVKLLVILAWFQHTLLVLASLAGLLGQRYFAWLPLVIMLALVVDEIHKRGLARMLIPEPTEALGRRFNLFRIFTIALSTGINIALLLFSRP